MHTSSLHTKTTTHHFGDDPAPTRIRTTYGWIWHKSNSAPYFRITDEIIDPGSTDDPQVLGAIHTEIRKAFPELNDLVELHLANAITGEPLHAHVNGWYWFDFDLENHAWPLPHRYLGMTPAQRAGDYLHCDPAVFDGVTTRSEFNAALDRLITTGYYRNKAAAAIAEHDLAEPAAH